MIKILDCKNKNYKSNLVSFLEKRRRYKKTNTNVVLTLDNFTGFANNFRCSILVLVGFSATVTVVPPLILEDTTGESGLISQDNQRSLFRIGNKLYII